MTSNPQFTAIPYAAVHDRRLSARSFAVLGALGAVPEPHLPHPLKPDLAETLDFSNEEGLFRQLARLRVQGHVEILCRLLPSGLQSAGEQPPGIMPVIEDAPPPVAEETASPAVVEDAAYSAVVEDAVSTVVAQETALAVVAENGTSPAVVEDAPPSAVTEEPAPAVVVEETAPLAVVEDAPPPATLPPESVTVTPPYRENPDSAPTAGWISAEHYACVYAQLAAAAATSPAAAPAVRPDPPALPAEPITATPNDPPSPPPPSNETPEERRARVRAALMAVGVPAARLRDPDPAPVAKPADSVFEILPPAAPPEPPGGPDSVVSAAPEPPGSPDNVVSAAPEPPGSPDSAVPEPPDNWSDPRASIPLPPTGAVSSTRH